MNRGRLDFPSHVLIYMSSLSYPEYRLSQKKKKEEEEEEEEEEAEARVHGRNQREFETCDRQR